MTPQSPSPASAFRDALELFETGVALMRQNLRRSRQNADDETIERLLHDWLVERPGAELGDCSGDIIDCTSKFS
jgi:hypothetical protein